MDIDASDWSRALWSAGFERAFYVGVLLGFPFVALLALRRQLEQREAIRNRNVLQLLAAGGNAYYLAKFAGIFGLDVQDIGAQQTGMSKDEFKARLLAARG